MSMAERLHCLACPGTALSPADMQALTCAACGGPLEPRLSDPVPFESLIDRERGLPWRYPALLPVGYVPELDDRLLPRTVRSSLLESRLGVEEVWLVDCTCFGTGTFKDLEAAIVMAGIRETGLARVSVNSTGNTALAYRHYAQRAGVSCAIYIPRRNADKLGDIEHETDYPIYLVDTSYPDVARMAKGLALRDGWHHLGPIGWRLEGKASLAYWLYESIPDVDVIVQTVAGGLGPLGYEMGFRRLRRAVSDPRGVLGDHRYLLFQPADADTLGHAWRSGASRVDETELRLPPDPFEPTLQSPSPLSTLPLLKAAMPAATRLESVDPKVVSRERPLIEKVLADADIKLDYHRERSAYIALGGLLFGDIGPARRLAIVVTGSRPFRSQQPADARPVLSP